MGGERVKNTNAKAAHDSGEHQVLVVVNTSGKRTGLIIT
jgi:hypothetical protein